MDDIGGLQTGTGFEGFFLLGFLGTVLLFYFSFSFAPHQKKKKKKNTKHKVRKRNKK